MLQQVLVRQRCKTSRSPAMSVTHLSCFAYMQSMLRLGAGGFSFTQNTVQNTAQGRRTDQSKGAKLKKRGGTAALAQVPLLKPTGTILLTMQACTAQLLVCAFVRYFVTRPTLAQPRLLSS